MRTLVRSSFGSFSRIEQHPSRVASLSGATPTERPAFAEHYNHAVPFDGDAIEAIWDRCRDLRCGTARRKAEGMLEDGSWTFSATGLRGAKVPMGSVIRSLEPSPATPDLSPEPEFD